MKGQVIARLNRAGMVEASTIDNLLHWSITQSGRNALALIGSNTISAV